MRLAPVLCTALLLLFFGMSSAWALVQGKKVALVIGNSAYVHADALPKDASPSIRPARPA
jgi:hypothetical protein